MLVYQCRVKGMWCPACAWVIQTALSRMTGIIAAECDFAVDRLQCRYDPVNIAPHEIGRAVAALGYDVRSGQDSEHGRRLQTRPAAPGCFASSSVNVMMLSWALYSGFFTHLTPQGIGYFVLPGFRIDYPGHALRRGAGVAQGLERNTGRSAGNGNAGRFGAGSAFALSVINLRAGSIHLYFDTAAMLVTLLLLGKWPRPGQGARPARPGWFLNLQPNKVRLCTALYPDGRYAPLIDWRLATASGCPAARWSRLTDRFLKDTPNSMSPP